MIFRVALIALAISTFAFAGGNEVGPQSTEVIFQVDSVDSISQLVAELSVKLAATEEDMVVTALVPRLGIYKIAHPPASDDQQQDEVDLIFEGVDGVLGWDRNLDVDIFAGGQTGSLWVSGVDINAASYHDQYTVDTLGITATHTRTMGQGVLVAVLDTGIDATHPEVLGRVSNNGINLIEGGAPTEGGNGEDDDQDGYIDEAVGHGTFCSGLITLLAPESFILPIKVLNGDGIGSLSDIILGMEAAVNGGAHVIVLALGTNQITGALDQSISDAIAQGITIVAAVGNGENSVGTYGSLYPASHPEVIGAGASDHLDAHATFSNYDVLMNLFAPGNSVLIEGAPVASQSVIGPLPGGEYAAGIGTSFSTAFTAGVIALVRAKGIDWPNAEIPLEEISETISGYLEASSVSIELPPGPTTGEKPRLDPPRVMVASGLPPVPPEGDLDGDGFVTGADLAVLLGAWGPLELDGSLYRVDIVRDEEINGADLASLLGAWSPSGGKG